MKNLILATFLLMFISGCLSIFWKRSYKPYSFFIEFENSYGIHVGTPVRMRGVVIGKIKKIQLKADSVLVLATIHSSRILVPVNSLVETTQTGLLNDSVIDIIPCNQFVIPSKSSSNIKIQSRLDHNSVYDGMYITGQRGLNYDDLIRSTTRISQRFDDPRFFNLFYVFLQNGIELTDTCFELILGLLEITVISSVYLQKFINYS
uniref:Mce/MlaD domain-containing protein n=1 Tax=Neogoniolithon spectabile TaxID=231755 RepID=A0A3G3MH06_9FLOR|nr:hypothetical protein [Neogoniolithon spectabile]AYR06116.1 hypothetical protein [Neogoniolithon spectabile]